MAQPLRVHKALAEDQSLVLSTVSGVSHLSLSSDPGDFDASGLCIYMLIHKHIIKHDKQL